MIVSIRIIRTVILSMINLIETLSLKTLSIIKLRMIILSIIDLMTTISIMTLRMTILSIIDLMTTLSIMTLRMTILSIIDLITILSLKIFTTECYYAECCVFIVMLSVVILNAVRPSVLAPSHHWGLFSMFIIIPNKRHTFSQQKSELATDAITPFLP
jgi:hypothetical protein